MSTVDLVTVFVAHELDIMDDEQVVQWACDQLVADSSLNDFEFVELAGLTRQQFQDVRTHLHVCLQRERPGFALDSPEGETIGKRLFAQLAGRYLSREAPANDLCRTVELIEGAFDFPEWIGSLWNCCDSLWPECSGAKSYDFIDEEVARVIEILDMST